MLTLALRSLRYRATAFTATFVSVLVGTAVIGSFATLFEASTGPVSTVDRDTLVIMGAVVGGWGTAIVLFSLASTLGITVQQRDVEIATLRTIGTTPRQARRLVRAETLVVAVVAASIGSVVAWFGGRALLAMLREGGLVAETVRPEGGWSSVGGAALAVVLTSLLSASIAARRATSGPATRALSAGRSGSARMRWWRVLAAGLLVAYGVTMTVITITVTADSDDPYAAMQTSGSSSILVGLGLALLAPVLLRWTATLVRPLVSRAGATGHLAAYNTTRRAHLLAGVLAPVIVFTASSVGILMLISIDGRAGHAADPDADTITLLNNVVVGMISLFAAIMVVNAFAAVTAHRRAELARLQLLGATRQQLHGSIVTEAAVVAVVGVGFGLLAASATVLPFAVARDEGVLPDGQLWLAPALAATAVLLTLAAAAGAVRRTVTTPSVALSGAGR